MKAIRNPFTQIVAGLLFLTLLSACIPSSAPIKSPDFIPTAITELPRSTITPSPFPTQTERPSITPTPDTWKINECRKVLSIVDSHFTDFIWNYTGNIEGRGRVDMLLDFTKNNEIRGFIFDFGLVHEYKVNGCIEDRSFTMWLQGKDRVEAVIQGEFPSTDPRGTYSIGAIKGLLVERNHSKSSAIYLSISFGAGKNMEHRFQLNRTKDDTLILNAAKHFLDAVASDNRAMVLEALQFPVTCEIKRERKEFKTPAAFLSYYNAIFGDGFKERLAITFPNYIIDYPGKVGGIGLSVYGGGAIFFDVNGKIIGIYNQKEATPTPTVDP
jgi:hypothetical protein